MLLSRVANDIYWMSRYVERAENTARFIEVNWHLMLDLPDSGEGQWEPLILVSGDQEWFLSRYGVANRRNVMTFLTFDAENPNSILACLTRARENARAVREQISTDMWEQLNTFYLLVKGASEEPYFMDGNPMEFFRQVKTNGSLLGGLADDTMRHDEAWHFFRLGRNIERAEKTSRILDVKYFILLPDVQYVGSAYDIIQWAALLRSTSGLEIFRQLYGRITPEKVVAFLLLDACFPRSIRWCLAAADYSLRAISGTPQGSFVNQAERCLGQMLSELAYADSVQIMATGLHEFIDRLQIKLNRLDAGIYSTFFAWDPLPLQQPEFAGT